MMYICEKKLDLLKPRTNNAPVVGYAWPGDILMSLENMEKPRKRPEAMHFFNLTKGFIGWTFKHCARRHFKEIG